VNLATPGIPIVCHPNCLAAKSYITITTRIARPRPKIPPTIPTPHFHLVNEDAAAAAAAWASAAILDAAA
jgi:hypothetical protein